MAPCKYSFVPAIVLLGVLAACTQPQNSQDLREQTAKATAQIKSDAKAVAEGVREGWSRNKPLDLNTATKDQLLSLPDLTEAQADRVIAGRPYNDPNDLVKRHILPKSEYDKIADQLTARK
jgi:DNA uptake protein ComE-like DNA-binding protein